MKMPDIELLGDRGLLLRLGHRIDAQCNRDVHALAAMVNAVRPVWLLDIVPAYASLALHFDVDRMQAAYPVISNSDQDPLDTAITWLRSVLQTETAKPLIRSDRTIEIRVRYGGADGPDLDVVARHAQLTPDQVIERHMGVDYSVAMIGFAPGFPYLLGMDASLAMPRRSTPRSRVPAGSIGIGAAQTGIYPREGPGGWQLIGRTDAILFDPSNGSDPSLLRPGDHVRFVPVESGDIDT